MDLSTLFGQDETGKDLFIVIEVNGRGPMSQETTRMTVPGHSGSYYQSRSSPERILEVRFFLNGQSLSGLQDKIDRLNDILNVDEPVPIIFADQPDKTFYGILDGDADWQEIQDKGIGTITFVCPDPHKYGREKTQTINDPEGEEDDASPIVNNEGTTDTYPIFRAEVLKPLTFLQIVKDDAYMQVGQPISDVDTEVDQYERVLSDNLSSLSGWTALPGGTVLQGGIVGGKMDVKLSSSGEPFAFYASSYGTNVNGYVGPAVKRALDTALQDFRVAINASALNGQGGIGKIFLYLLDDQDRVIGFLCMEDIWSDIQRNRAQIFLGESPNIHGLINSVGVNFNTVYNNFEGVLRLDRIGNQFYAYVAQVDPVTGFHHGRYVLPVYTDTAGLYQQPLAQVMIYIAKYKSFDTFDITANDLSVFKINDVSANQVPTIANSGDILTFDHQKKLLLSNGDPGLMQAKDFGATFFPFAKGQNQLLVNPPDAIKLTAQWRGADL